MLSKRECIEIEQERLGYEIREAQREKQRVLDEQAVQLRISRTTWSREQWFDGTMENGTEDPGSIVEDTNPRKGTPCPTCGDVGCRRGGWHESCTVEG